MGKFVDCIFANADLSDVSISNSTFSNVNFLNVIGLKLDQTVTFEKACLISDDTYKNNSGFFRQLKINNHFKLVVHETIDLPREFQEIFKNESIDLSNFSPNWPHDSSEWQSDSLWANSDDSKNKVCFLKHDHVLAQFLTYFTHLTSDSVSYAACKLEDARLKKALSEGRLREFCVQELFGSGLLSNKERPGSIVIKKVI